MEGGGNEEKGRKAAFSPLALSQSGGFQTGGNKMSFPDYDGGKKIA